METNLTNGEDINKTGRTESLLVTYSAFSFVFIVVCISALALLTAQITKAPVEKNFSQSIEAILELADKSVVSWFDTQTEVLNTFQKAVVNSIDNRESIKKTIKTKKQPNGYEYVIVFWDDATGAADGGPETYNTKGGMSTAGIMGKEYWKMHKEKDVDVWLESPRKANAGGITLPLFVKSEFFDDVTGKLVKGGVVGFLELESIEQLGSTFYKTGNISIYDDKNELRAGKDIFGENVNKDSLQIYSKECKIENKVWTIYASIEKSEIGEITGNLRRNSLVGGIVVAIILTICILILIRKLIGKIDSIRVSVDDLNRGDKDLTKRLVLNHNNEITQVKKTVNIFVNTVHETVKQIGNANQELTDSFNHVKKQLSATESQIDCIASQIQDATDTLSDEDKCVLNTSSSVTQISRNIKSLNAMIDSQADAIIGASSSIEEMIGNIKSVSASVEKMSSEFSELNAATVDGIEKNKIVNELLQTVLDQSKSLQTTNKVISDISSQTNLLSMNAMIESAHAGEAGKGFAVVAEEIRKLADTSASQSKSIGENLKKIADNITKVVESANASKESFEIVSDKTNNTSNLVEVIKRAMDEQTEGSKHILEVLSTMTNTSNQVQTSSKEIEEGTNEILDSITSLKDSSENMSENFSKIVSTTEETRNTTNNLHSLTEEMTTAVNNISEKIGEFKF